MFFYQITVLLLYTQRVIYILLRCHLVPNYLKTIPTNYLEGEISPLSSIQIGTRHPNTAIDNVPANQQVICNGLVKIRANSEEDAEGVKNDVTSPGIPYHVPWV
jgi:hypothetical protein